MVRALFGLARGTAIAVAICSAPALSYYSSSSQSDASIESRISTFEPGQFAWHPERASEGDVQIVVSIPMQTAFVFRGGTLIGASTVSTGMAGYDTPAGRYPILQKRKAHFSNLYDNAPMPYMQRLTWDGIALHAGAIPGYPASHGCVRLPKAFAAKLFAVTALGAEVVIADEAIVSPEQALAMIEEGAPVLPEAAGGIIAAAP